MKKATWKKTSFAEKIVEIIRTSPSINEMREQLQDYHDNDIAQSLQFLNRAERNLLYSALDAEWLAEIISYLDDPAEYIDEIGIDKLAEILNEMDADDGRSVRRGGSQRNHQGKHEKAPAVADHPAVPRHGRFDRCRCI